MNLRILAVMLVIAILQGCSSLPQSALIYSSRSTVGVSITSNPASASGVTMSVGVDILDAAYVPVAVTLKNPDGSSGGNSVVPISAEFGTTGGGDNQVLTDANKAKLDEYVQALNKVTDLQKQIQLLKDSKQPTDGLQRQIKEANTKVDSLTKATPSDDNAIKNAISDRNLSQSQLNDVIAKNQDFDTKIVAGNTELQVAKEAADNKRTAAVQAAKLLSLNKKDAFSVYGRFDGNTSGNGSVTAAAGNAPMPSASLALVVGKIFSTGVASQNLTEAARISASSEALASCLAAAQAIGASLQTKDDSQVKKWADSCMAASTRTSAESR